MNVRTPDPEPLQSPAADELQAPRRLPMVGPLLLLVGTLGMLAVLRFFPDYLANLLGPLFVIVSLIGLYWTVISGVAWFLRRLRERGHGGRR